jgi:hypothetical protein
MSARKLTRPHQCANHFKRNLQVTVDHPRRWRIGTFAPCITSTLVAGSDICKMRHYAAPEPQSAYWCTAFGRVPPIDETNRPYVADM